MIPSQIRTFRVAENRTKFTLAILPEIWYNGIIGNLRIRRCHILKEGSWE